MAGFSADPTSNWRTMKRIMKLAARKSRDAIAAFSASELMPIESQRSQPERAECQGAVPSAPIGSFVPRAMQSPRMPRSFQLEGAEGQGAIPSAPICSLVPRLDREDSHVIAEA
eukprot:1903248-Pyramimonas_sp.AAC.1